MVNMTGAVGLRTCISGRRHALRAGLLLQGRKEYSCDRSLISLTLLVVEQADVVHQRARDVELSALKYDVSVSAWYYRPGAPSCV
jgi:hypothetical protein